MLTLTRHPGERIVIMTPAGNVTVTYLGLDAMHGDRAKLGFEAPLTIPINRDRPLPAAAAAPTPDGASS